MGLSNKQLLLLDALGYYSKFSDNVYSNVSDFVNNARNFNTCFNDDDGYTDEDLGMHKILL